MNNSRMSEAFRCLFGPRLFRIYTSNGRQVSRGSAIMKLFIYLYGGCFSCRFSVFYSCLRFFYS